MSESAYASSGVNIDAGQEAVSLIKKYVSNTYTKDVLSDLGSFGGLFSLQSANQLENPVLVASTDGVGTKVKLAAQYNRLQGVGMDIVNHCIDDILVQGASPLFFLNYFATSKLIPQQLEEIVHGMSIGCKASNCAILGGETAEMPGVYCENEFDVAGTIVGVVSQNELLPRNDVVNGDVLIGIASSGPHTNGYSLIRNIFEGMNLDKHYEQINGNLADALLEPHRNYHALLKSTFQMKSIKAMAHITGGGFYDNIPRILPKQLGVKICKSNWPCPPLFSFIQETGNVDPVEMFRVFNMGIGLILVVSKEEAEAVQTSIPEQTWIIGEVTQQPGVIIND